MYGVNPALMIDGYKLDHRRQYPKGTEFVYSNWTPRTSRIPEITEVVFFGLQYFLERYLGHEWEEFFQTERGAACTAYEKRVNSYLGPNQIGSDHIAELWDLGYLPLEFRALTEGTSVPLNVPMLTVENTHPNFAWLVNYLETIMSSVLWMPCTSATTAKRLRKLFEKWADITGSPQEFVDWQGHDFSFRGLPGLEAACLSGMGHLTAFTGTDTIPAIECAETYYPVPEGYLMGGSVAATEHSVMCAGGEDGELETFERLLDLYPTGILSVVSDTWDLWKVITEVLPALKDRIMARDGKLVIRPDSGDPVDIVAGTATYGKTPVEKGVIELLWEIFGGVETSTGHKLLDPHIGVIYGDSINYERADAILQRLHWKGFASANMVFGIGSFTYQFTTRDTFGFAMKATHVTINGVGKDIFKKPVTDNGGKFSHKGRLAVLEDAEGKLYVVGQAQGWEVAKSKLQTVWRNGKFWNDQRLGFDDVRANARA